MKFLSLVGNSFGCSASGERLVSAARDGDILEAKALLEYNPRLARYSTFGARNSPLHYSSAQGHHEIVSLLLQSGVEINLRNYRGQTALMQACQHGHWEVVLVLILFKANIHRMDYLNGGTALHLAALNGHSRCIRLLLADYIPSVPDFWNMLTKKSGSNKKQIPKYETNHQSSYITALSEVINKPADGGITALHMAALNGHVETVQLLLDLGALVSKVTVEDGTTIDLIGAGSTALHYAACGGNSQCCRMLIARGASLTAENANGWTPLMVARSWHRDCLEEVLSARSEAEEEDLKAVPSPYSWLPLMSIIKIARECGWRYNDSLLSCQDPCVVCLERKCSVAAEGCEHEFCTNCALYLCSTNCCSISTNSPPGSIACPLCRNGIVSFLKLAETRPIYKENSSNSARTSLSLSFCPCTGETSSFSESTSLTTPFCDNRNRFHSARVLSPSFRSLSCQRLRSMKNVNSSLCMGGSDICPSLIPPTCSSSNWNLRDHFARCSRSRCRRSSSQSEARRSSWLSSLNHCVTTGN